MKHKEASFGILFRHWIKANPQKSASFELKDTRGKSSLLFSALEDHQINYSLAINGNKGTFIRIQGINGEPDYIYLRNAPAYIVIKYPSFFVMISIKKFIQEKARSKLKSLTEQRAKHISVISIKT